MTSPLNEQQFFHASNHMFQPGEKVLPRRDVEFEPPGHPRHDPYSWDEPDDNMYGQTPHEAWEDAGDSSGGFTYFSNNLNHGRQFAKHIFQVEPTGPAWDDHAEGTFESQHPLKVIRHVESR